MSSFTQTLPERATGGPQSPGEELCHLVEMDSPDRALCGKDVSGFPWDPPWPYCVVCVDLARHMPHWAEDLRRLGLD